MRLSAYHILRVGLGITFAWFGILIIQNPSSWATFIEPWAVNLLPISVNQAMLFTGIFDLIIGVWLISGIRIFIPALFATLHLAGVLVATSSSLQDVIVRDIGLFAATLALTIDAKNG